MPSGKAFLYSFPINPTQKDTRCQMLKPFAKIGLMLLNGQRQAHTLTCSTFKASGSMNNGSWKNLHWILADSPQRYTQLCCQDANWARRKPKQDSSAYGSFQSTVTIPTGSDAPQLVGRSLSGLLTVPVNNLATCPL